MGFLTARDEAAVRKEFERLTGPVKLTVFSQSLVAADLCQQNEQLVREVAALDDHLSVDSIVLASTGEPTLSEATKTALGALTENVHIQVFSTPT